MALPESKNQTLLITGINGYIASVLGHLLLTKGYNIRGTARKAESTKPLIDGVYQDFKERVEIFEVPDMTVPGAFDEAVKGVNGIFHVASPIDMSTASYESMVETAEAGNLTLLNSALLHASPHLTSVTTTSSVAAISNPPVPTGFIQNESQHAHVALSKAQQNHAQNIESPPAILYMASKTAAERALWKFRDEKKPKWSISTINPTTVIGPPVVLPEKAAGLNETLKPIWGIFSGEMKDIPPNIGVGAFVDVRDVAVAHLWCYENSGTGKVDGERFITAAGFGPHQAAADILREAYPERRGVILEGEVGKGYVLDGEGKVDYEEGAARCDGGKVERVMGLGYRDFRSSLLDTVREMEKLL